MRQRAADARVARLASIRANGKPHLVPCCFAIEGDLLYSAVDDVKPKLTTRLRRLDNIRAQPAVTVLVDHYSEVWAELWWIRLDGDAHLAEPDTPGNDAGHELLRAKYDQYRREPPTGLLITVEVVAWRAWP